MSEESIRVLLPRLPDPSVFENADRTVKTAVGDALLSFDPSTRCGFVYKLASGRWIITTRIDFTEFCLFCAAAGYCVADNADGRRWYEANNGGPVPTGMLN